jgi:hypothetical protein
VAVSASAKPSVLVCTGVREMLRSRVMPLTCVCVVACAVERMLDYDPATRIKPMQALNHPFLREDDVPMSPGGVGSGAAAGMTDGTTPCCVLCCAVLCCAVLCCAVLCCAVLCCAVLCCAVLCCAMLCYAVLC